MEHHAPTHGENATDKADVPEWFTRFKMKQRRKGLGRKDMDSSHICRDSPHKAAKGGFYLFIIQQP